MFDHFRSSRSDPSHRLQRLRGLPRDPVSPRTLKTPTRGHWGSWHGSCGPTPLVCPVCSRLGVPSSPALQDGPRPSLPSSRTGPEIGPRKDRNTSRTLHLSGLITSQRESSGTQGSGSIRHRPLRLPVPVQISEEKIQPRLRVLGSEPHDTPEGVTGVPSPHWYPGRSWILLDLCCPEVESRPLVPQPPTVRPVGVFDVWS